MWERTWGQFVVGQTALVPSLGWWGALLLGVLLGMTAALALRFVRAQWVGAFVLSIALIVPIAARALPLPSANENAGNASQLRPSSAQIGIVTARIGLSSEATFSKLMGPAYSFVGSTVDLTTTATQRITGAATASLSFVAAQTGRSPGPLNEALCYRPSGTTQPLVTFAGQYGTGIHHDLIPNIQMVPPLTASTGTSTVTDTVVPGAGTWQVGRCLQNQSPSDLHVITMTGWFQITPQ
jgi:hypothetical protein